MGQQNLFEGRILVWFSCGAASAIAAMYAIQKYAGRCEILYCDTFAYEHPDNRRFFNDVQNWLGVEIKILKSKKYADIFDVFNKTGWLVGPMGARCTTELKKVVRKDYQNPEDTHILGYTSEESKRVKQFRQENPELAFDWILKDVSKKECLEILSRAGVELPAMYKLGYKNNNCIGCVKGQMGYWNKIRKDFPEAFDRMAKQERKMNVSICGKTFLDELEPNRGRYKDEPDIECNVVCSGTKHHPTQDTTKV